MVGIGPDEQGTFHPTAVAQLKEVGRWLKVNGAGIYATRARAGDLWSEGEHIRYSRSKDGKMVFSHKDSLDFSNGLIMPKVPCDQLK